MAKFLVYVAAENIHTRFAVAGVIASNEKKADEFVMATFGPGYVALRYTKPAGWKDNGGDFLTKDSAYGVKYLCKVCGKVHLGIGRSYNHWPRCPLHK